MENLRLYHGTDKNSGNNIINSSTMRSSRGDCHWLGDGCYFYEDDFWAYKWIKDQNVSGFFIVECLVEVKKERVFNFDTMECKYAFETTYEECMNLARYEERIKLQHKREGVILNIMFNDMGYDQHYDIVICTFNHRNDNNENYKIRTNYILEKQICIKNNKCIKNFCVFDFIKKIDSYHEIMDRYYSNKYIFKKKKIY